MSLTLRRGLVLALVPCCFAASSGVASAGPGLTKEQICERWPNLPARFRLPDDCPAAPARVTLPPCGGVFAPLAFTPFRVVR